MSTVVKFSEAASIALHGTVLIARTDKFFNVTKIAETMGASRHHVAKVMQRLAKVGYIKSMRGPTGGFLLVKKPEEISFLNLYEAIEGNVKVEKWPEGSFEEKLLSDITNNMTEDFIDYMKNQTVADFL